MTPAEQVGQLAKCGFEQYQKTIDELTAENERLKDEILRMSKITDLETINDELLAENDSLRAELLTKEVKVKKETMRWVVKHLAVFERSFGAYNNSIGAAIREIDTIVKALPDA